MYIYLIHDDVTIATKNMSDHIKTVRKIMEAVSLSGLTVNPDECHFEYKEIKFWDMIYSAERMKPDPAKVCALKYISPPSKKDDLTSFLCMMQSDADFIENFAQKATPLWELTLHDFTKDTLVRYFFMKKKIYIFTDAHISGLGAILTQGDNYQGAKPIVIALQTTSQSEKKVPPTDLETTAIKFA